MSEQELNTPHSNQTSAIETNTYEILRNRLNESRNELNDRLDRLNQKREDAFGAIEMILKATERVTTENNCVPWDMFTIGNQFLFGYNVHIGLKNEIDLSDVFSIYSYEASDQNFHQQPITLINDESFINHFKQLYTYYKKTKFVKFMEVGPFLHMIFNIGEDPDDIKTFKWAINDHTLSYVDNRSEYDIKYPKQHEFEWNKTSREDFVDGKFPHVSILDRVFVETNNGELTIKIEDNTDSGKGIYSEKVEHNDQTLGDADFQYSALGQLILLKITPYQEESRFFIFNEKLKEVKRIDTIKESCILLPDDQGIIFSNGYYQHSGELKIFDAGVDHMVFEKKIQSPNGEDFLYVFYQKTTGRYLLLNYNLIKQKVDSPIICHGFSFFENGEMCLFRSDDEPKKHHAIQLWQTTFSDADYQNQEQKAEGLIGKVGNKDIVKGMSACKEIIKLIDRKNIYDTLYIDLINFSTNFLDTNFWAKEVELENLSEPVEKIKKIASQMTEEFDKVKRIQTETSRSIDAIEEKQKIVRKKINALSSKNIQEYVDLLKDIRTLKGELVGAKSLRYAPIEKLENLEEEIGKESEKISKECVRFLLKKEALVPYETSIKSLEEKINNSKTATELESVEIEADETVKSLDLLIDIVNNLKIHDATQTAKIIENITDQYTIFNQINAGLKAKKKSLILQEGKAEFNAQLKLVEQSVTNLLDISKTPEQCDENANRLITQLEELEGKFAEFEEYTVILADKRTDIYNAFEAKKLSLVEKRTRQADQLQKASTRILNSIKNKANSLKTIQEIQSYFAADLMVEKIKTNIEKLIQLKETVRADSLQSQLNSLSKESIRQLKDKQELFSGAEGTIQLGNHLFYVNSGKPELTMISKGESLAYHITSTNFYEKVDEQQLNENQSFWNQLFVSENELVYRGEYLAYVLYLMLHSKIKNPLSDLEEHWTIQEYVEKTEEEKLAFIRKIMAIRFDEGYIKGVHGLDALIILDELLEVELSAGLTKFNPNARALAIFFWHYGLGKDNQKAWKEKIQAAGLILKVFPKTKDFDHMIDELQTDLKSFAEEISLFKNSHIEEAAHYLFNEVALSRNDSFHFVLSQTAEDFYKQFENYLKVKKALKNFRESISALNDDQAAKLKIIRLWLQAFIVDSKQKDYDPYIDEVSVLLLVNDINNRSTIHIPVQKQLQNMKGAHRVIENKVYRFELYQFKSKLSRYFNEIVPAFKTYISLKSESSKRFEETINLDQFKPKVMSAFVRNQLIDKVYLPMIGANLAKQMGSAGANKRTDQMGLLLLISPPGYGKTTLMEYIANRMGLIFMKINGPALGHEVTSLDPSSAPNATAKEELEKLGLSFEMGDNVMIYLDDIQHCNPEFLQKFISLCDAQRKIEGVYKGKTKTYDFRGKKLSVVMAGNPYTESGDKFQIPDMLSNRADVYNLGDVIGGSAASFESSYIENALTSNNILAPLNDGPRNDIYELIKTATEQDYQAKLEGAIGADQLSDMIKILKHVITVRNVILKVNALYIESAGKEEQYRTEPSFKLQGSYRDMNKIVEKLDPIMNEEEVMTLIFSHYENESQTLTTGAEANFLRFKILIGKNSDSEMDRWNQILEIFEKEKAVSGHAQTMHMANMAHGIQGIEKHIERLTSKG